jgi:uncharacterized SAM-binding protein YcdF (DUF218 family)
MQSSEAISIIAILAKKLVSVFVSPLGFSLSMLVLGAILLRRRNGRSWGVALVTGGILCLFFASLPITGYLLLHPLEVEAGDYVSPTDLAAREAQNVVVLGATVVTSELSDADRWSGEGVLRVVEGVRVWKGISKGKLILSAGSFPGRRSSVEAMIGLPLYLGIPKESLILENRASNTIEEAKLLASILGKERPFALVTSAAHIPRSMDIFRSLGMKPIACPCAFRTKEWPIWYAWFVPDVSGLHNSHIAFHEHMGRLWAKFSMSMGDN